MMSNGPKLTKLLKINQTGPKLFQKFQNEEVKNLVNFMQIEAYNKAIFHFVQTRMAISTFPTFPPFFSTFSVLSCHYFHTLSLLSHHALQTLLNMFQNGLIPNGLK